MGAAIEKRNLMVEAKEGQHDARTFEQETDIDVDNEALDELALKYARHGIDVSALLLGAVNSEPLHPIITNPKVALMIREDVLASLKEESEPATREQPEDRLKWTSFVVP